MEPTNDTSWDYSLSTSLSTSQMDNLDKSISHVEIDEAVKNLAPWKAPGSKGFPAGFYQNNWSFVKNNIYSLIQSWCEGTLIYNVLTKLC